MSESVFSENMLDFRDKLPFFKDIQTNATQERIVEELPEILGGLSDAIFLNNNWSEQKIEIHSDEVFTPVKNISNEEIIFP